MRCAELKQDLFSLLAENGAELMGVADLSDIISGEIQTGIAVAVSVPVNIVRRQRNIMTYIYLERNAGRYRYMRSRIFERKRRSGVCEHHKSCETE